MDNGGCWCLTVAMDGKMKIAFDGVGNGQRQGGGQTTVHFLAVGSNSAMEDSKGGGNKQQ